MSRSIRASALLAAVAALGLFVSPAGASILTMGGASYVGSINDGIPSSPADEVAYINSLITLGAGDGDTVIGSETYNRVGSTLTGLPSAVAAGSDKVETSSSTVLLTGSFKYILGKYDAAQAGSLVWYSATGFSGSMTLPTSYNGKGISHISVYNPTNGGGGGVEEIPEPISFAVWCVLSVVGFGAVYARRRC